MRIHAIFVIALLPDCRLSSEEIEAQFRDAVAAAQVCAKNDSCVEVTDRCGDAWLINTKRANAFLDDTRTQARLCLNPDAAPPPAFAFSTNPRCEAARCTVDTIATTDPLPIGTHTAWKQVRPLGRVAVALSQDGSLWAFGRSDAWPLVAGGHQLIAPSSKVRDFALRQDEDTSVVVLDDDDRTFVLAEDGWKPLAGPAMQTLDGVGVDGLRYDLILHGSDPGWKKSPYQGFSSCVSSTVTSQLACLYFDERAYGLAASPNINEALFNGKRLQSLAANERIQALTKEGEWLSMNAQNQVVSRAPARRFSSLFCGNATAESGDSVSVCYMSEGDATVAFVGVSEVVERPQALAYTSVVITREQTFAILGDGRLFAWGPALEPEVYGYDSSPAYSRK